MTYWDGLSSPGFCHPVTSTKDEGDPQCLQEENAGSMGGTDPSTMSECFKAPCFEEGRAEMIEHKG